METLVNRLRTRSDIRKNIKNRRSVQEGKPDLICELLDEAADMIEELVTKASTSANYSTCEPSNDDGVCERIDCNNHSPAQPALKPLSDKQTRSGFRQTDKQVSFRVLTYWQVWQKAKAWTEAAHNIKEQS